MMNMNWHEEEAKKKGDDFFKEVDAAMSKKEGQSSVSIKRTSKGAFTYEIKVYADATRKQLEDLRNKALALKNDLDARL